MLRHMTFLAAVLALATCSVAAFAAPAEDAMLSASGGDDFVQSDWTADDPLDLPEWDDGIFLPDSIPDHDLELGETAAWPFAAPLAGPLDNDPHVLDRRFNGSGMHLDRFGAGSNDTASKYGHKVLRLSNGHVVAVALVPPLGSGGPIVPVPSNIGLIRYNAAGVRQKWANAASVFTDADRYHYVFPNDVAGPDGNFTAIHDVKEHDGWIYVLATRGASAVRVVRLALSSSRWRWTSVPSATAGAGMHFYKDGDADKLVVVSANVVDSSNTRTSMTRYDVASDQVITRDPAFGTGGTRDVTWRVYATPRRVGGDRFGSTYVAGDYVIAGRSNGYVASLGTDGVPHPNWGTDGVVRFGFELVSGGETFVRDVALAPSGASLTSLWILAASDAGCGTTAAGIVNISGRKGEFQSAFGPAGQMSFGGGGSGPPISPCTNTRSFEPHGIERHGNRLAVVGYSRYSGLAVPPASGLSGGPALAIVHASNGTLLDSRVLRPTTVNIGAEGAGSVLRSVAAGEGDDFFAVGTATDSQNNKKSMVMTVRVRADRIFGHGME